MIKLDGEESKTDEQIEDGTDRQRLGRPRQRRLAQVGWWEL